MHCADRGLDPALARHDAGLVEPELVLDVGRCEPLGLRAGCRCVAAALGVAARRGAGRQERERDGEGRARRRRCGRGSGRIVPPWCGPQVPARSASTGSSDAARRRGVGAGQQADERAEERRAERDPRVEDGRPGVGSPTRRRSRACRALAPMRPPASPIAVLSSRNCAATWRRPAPSARRRPISPTRSSTETSVTLAIPIAPTRSETPPRSRKSALRSFFDGAAQLARVGRGGDLEQARVAGTQRERRLARDQVDGADAGLDLGERGRRAGRTRAARCPRA